MSGRGGWQCGEARVPAAVGRHAAGARGYTALRHPQPVQERQEYLTLLTAGRSAAAALTINVPGTCTRITLWRPP